MPNMLVRQEYKLPEADRLKIISSLPPKNQSQRVIVPNSMLCQNTGYFSELQGLSCSQEVAQQRARFIARYGNDGVDLTSAI